MVFGGLMLGRLLDFTLLPFDPCQRIPTKKSAAIDRNGYLPKNSTDPIDRGCVKTQRESRPKIFDLSERAVFNSFELGDGQGTSGIEQIGADDAFSHRIDPFRTVKLTA
jgi:hypothetical protein